MSERPSAAAAAEQSASVLIEPAPLASQLRPHSKVTYVCPSLSRRGSDAPSDVSGSSRSAVEPFALPDTMSVATKRSRLTTAVGIDWPNGQARKHARTMVSNHDEVRDLRRSTIVCE